MKRASIKKGTDKRTKKSKSRSSKQEVSADKKGQCYNCSKNLKGVERALFVEEEVGRIFCSEDCITSYFGPEIERLEKEYFRRLSPNDLSSQEREKLTHLRWITLQEPDEIWREKTISGDYRFTLISEFQPEERQVWCVCICLLLRGEPSFLYLAFSTRNAAMVNTYRKGERVQLVKDETDGKAEGPTDGLADEWTEDETIRAQLGQERSSNDIPPTEFALYQGCLEETLETPDEVWSVPMSGRYSARLFHFIRYYPDESEGIWYLVVAREMDEEQIEILDAFPTRDSALVQQYRKGDQEVGAVDTTASQSRVVH